jgi:hypothetical protein
MSSRSASCFGFFEVPIIGVDVEYHVAGVVADCRVGVGGTIIQELGQLCFGVFRCCCLLGSKAADDSHDHVVDCATVV